ncbi:hypothetical protein AB0I30_35645 [Nocardia tengchongensis]|uniref:hypothetical protein n=1 Tax=Nocardia tengchongensis TaxID=2055889 RepID=UPI003403C80D
MQQPDTNPYGSAGGPDRLDDEDFPTYSMGRAAEILGVTLQHALDEHQARDSGH